MILISLIKIFGDILLLTFTRLLKTRNRTCVPSNRNSHKEEATLKVKRKFPGQYPRSIAHFIEKQEKSTGNSLESIQKALQVLSSNGFKTCNFIYPVYILYIFQNILKHLRLSEFYRNNKLIVFLYQMLSNIQIYTKILLTHCCYKLY